jgi:hypothetical protein
MAVDMNRNKLYRLWLLFVVVATGLVWTWSQVGQHGGRPDKIDGESLELLRTEAGCDLAVGPCAAYGAQVGMVASARVEGEGVRWRVRLVGKGVPALPRVRLSLLPARGDKIMLSVVQTADEWQARTAGRVTTGSTLRVRVEGGAQPLVADFPLGSAH